MVSTERTRFLVEALEKMILVIAIVKREYGILLLFLIVALIVTKMYTDIVDIKKKKLK